MIDLARSQQQPPDMLRRLFLLPGPDERARRRWRIDGANLHFELSNSAVTCGIIRREPGRVTSISVGVAAFQKQQEFGHEGGLFSGGG